MSNEAILAGKVLNPGAFARSGAGLAPGSSVRAQMAMPAA
jgi:hypothetical protein